MKDSVGANDMSINFFNLESRPLKFVDATVGRRGIGMPKVGVGAGQSAAQRLHPAASAASSTLRMEAGDGECVAAAEHVGKQRRVGSPRRALVSRKTGRLQRC